jgi:hypothetical protein
LRNDFTSRCIAALRTAADAVPRNGELPQFIGRSARYLRNKAASAFASSSFDWASVSRPAAIAASTF